jgi:O-antigen/teichoic acid export membrane protein
VQAVATQTPAEDDLTVDARRRRLTTRRLPIPARGPLAGSLASAAVGQVALVVTGVVTARTLGPTDRGYLALVILVPAVLHAVGTLGLPRAVTYFIASDRASDASVLQAIRLPLVVQAISLTAVQALVLAVVLAGEPSRVHWAGAAVLPLLGAYLADSYGLAILQGQRRYFAFNVVRTSGMGLYLAGVLLLVAIGRTGLVDFAVAATLSTVLAGALTLATALARPTPSKGPARAEVSRRDLLRFSLRGFLAWLSPIATFRLDQLLIGLLLAPEALGLYVVGLAFTNVPTFVARSIGFIAFPQVAWASTARADEMRRFLWLSVALSGAAVLALEVLAGWLVPLFFGAEFEGAVALTRILLLAALFDGARHVLMNTASGSGRPGLGSIAELASWLFLVSAVLVLMPLWDERGVAAATVISAAASFLTLLVLVHSSSVGAHESSGHPVER